MDRYLVISSDCHTGPPAEVFRDYLDPNYRPQFEDFMDELRAAQPQGTLKSKFMGQDRSSSMQDTFLASDRVKEGGQEGAWDPVVREREMDQDGVAAEILFPVPQTPKGITHGFPPFKAGLMAYCADGPGACNVPYDVQWAGAQAYNRWLAELCSHNPARHHGAINCPMGDIEAAVGEIRQARKAGLSVLHLPTLGWATTELESMYHHPRFEPIWDVCEELELPLVSHPLLSGVDYGELPGKLPIYGIEVFTAAHRTWWFLLYGGVFERHPKLKFVITEAGGGWAPYMLWRLDELYEGAKDTSLRQRLPRKPSEYWADHGFIGASPPAGRLEVEQRDVIGVRNILWGSDYPHFEGTWPYSRQRMKAMFGGIPVEDVRLMLGESAVEVYGFDREKLAPIAERIGPPVSEFKDPSPVEAKDFLNLWRDQEALAELGKR